MIDSTEKTTELLRLVRKFDDQKAFEVLFDLYYAWLYSVAVDIVKKKEMADEVVEDVFFKLWEIRKKNNKINNLSTYLYVATKNHSYNRLRGLAKLPDTDDVAEVQLPDLLADPEQRYLVTELQSHIDRAIDHLPEKCREIFRLVRLEGLSHKRTAEILNLSQRTVENQLAIAVKKIIAELKPYLFGSNEPKHSA